MKDITTVKITSIAPKDFKETIKMIKRTIKISQGKIYPKALIDEFCHKYDFQNFKKKAREIDYFIAKDNEGRILGVIGLKGNALRTFFVDPELQGKGIGRQLFNYLEKKAKKRGIKKLILEGSSLGEPAYLKFGFVKIKTINKKRVGIKYQDAYMEKYLPS